jgi:hypothetical protein
LDKPALGADVYKAGASFDYIFGMVADNTRKWDDKMHYLPGYRDSAKQEFASAELRVLIINN